MKVLGAWNDRVVVVVGDDRELAVAVSQVRAHFVAVILMGSLSEDGFYHVASRVVLGGSSYVVAQSELKESLLHSVLDQVRDARRYGFEEEGVVITVTMSDPIEAIRFGTWLAIPDEELSAEPVRDVIIANFAAYDDSEWRSVLSAPFDD